MKEFFLRFLLIPLAIVITGNAVSAMEEKTNDPLIKLNIGGQIYIYPKSTLINSGDYFKSLLSGNYKNIIFDDGSIYISYSKEAFKEVDHFLTTGNLLLCCNIDVIIEAANFFGIDLMLKHLEEINQPRMSERKRVCGYKSLYVKDTRKCSECEKAVENDLLSFVEHLIDMHHAQVDCAYSYLNEFRTQTWEIMYRVPVNENN